MFNIHAKRVELYVNVPKEQHKQALTKLRAYCTKACDETGLMAVQTHSLDNGNNLAILKVTLIGIFADKQMYHTAQIEKM